jgi:hypothetical protein
VGVVRLEHKEASLEEVREGSRAGEVSLEEMWEGSRAGATRRPLWRC